MIREVKLVEDAGLRQQLELAAVRNATFIVLLRHTTAKLHAEGTGHARTVSWTVCNHPDCRRVAVMLGDRPTLQPFGRT